MRLSENDLNVIKILENIDSEGSISKASEVVNIKPGTGRNLISKLEKELGIEIVASIAFEGSKLTSKGKKLLRRYHKAQRFINRMNKPL